MDPILGPIIGGGISALGSLIGGQSQQREAERIAQQNIAAQYDFARHGIQWKVEDARAAGINPLAALGASTSSFSNVVGNTDAGSGMRGAGQDIGRAIAAASSIDMRSRELEAKLLEAKIANVNADTTQMLARSSDAARVNAPGTPPPIPLPSPSPRRVNWDAYYAKPLEEKYVGPNGGLISLPTAEASQAMQNWGSLPGQLAYAGSNIYSNLKNAVSDLWPNGVNWLPYRRDAWRGVDNSQYSPF